MPFGSSRSSLDMAISQRVTQPEPRRWKPETLPLRRQPPSPDISRRCPAFWSPSLDYATRYSASHFGLGDRPTRRRNPRKLTPISRTLKLIGRFADRLKPYFESLEKSVRGRIWSHYQKQWRILRTRIPNLGMERDSALTHGISSIVP